MLEKRATSIEEILQYSKTLTKLGREQRVLIVEDDVTANTQLTNFFKRFYSRVHSAKDGLEALALYRENQYDIIITDISMPNMDGLELCRRIRQISANQRIIIMTAHNDREFLTEALKHKVNEYIMKPLDINALVVLLCTISEEIERHRIDLTYNSICTMKNGVEPKILVIDDSRMALALLSDIVQKNYASATVYNAENGQEGIDTIIKHPDIELIFVDWNMPVMNGVEFVKKIKSEPVMKNVKVIMVSTQNEREKISEVVKLGINGYLVKPYSPESVEVVLRKYICGS